MTLEATHQAQPPVAKAPGSDRSARRARLRRRASLLGLAALTLAILAGLALAWLRPWADPQEIWAEGEAELKAGRIDRAEAASNRLARLRSPTPLDWMLRAQVDMARERIDLALAALDRVPDDHAMAAQARLMAGQIELRRHRAGCRGILPQGRRHRSEGGQGT